MSDLPTGTVTFLFTDIEGSTKLAQANPAEWETARQHHHVILRSAAESHNGFVFQVVGDAFCVAFATAPDALEAALDAQRALQAETWGETPIHVRMGLHTGTAEARDGDYQGYLTLAHVQRVMSTAYGGQTLESNATAALLSGQLPNGVTLRDMGEHRLKGLLNPEHLWQLIAQDLPQDFPPLPSLNAIPNNLPIQVTSFVGRERELSDLQRLLPTTRLLTLTGSGGTGKTRLSLQVAAEVLDSFKDGVWFVELAPLADPGLVPATIALVLGVREEQGRPLLATLLEWLRPKQLLLILDNCEHLIEGCAKFADAVLHASRETCILATSREALGIAGELAWRVPSLPTPNPNAPVNIAQLEQYAAAQLFIERALFALPAFAVTNSNAPAVAQICYRLDGIPLALELAATRVRSLSAEEIAGRLDKQFQLLTGGSRTVLPRQQTLRASIDWSYDLLADGERRLFGRVAIFAGGWSLSAAESVCGGNGLEANELVDLLDRLVTKSLVIADAMDGLARYRMLEPIRQYAVDKLRESGESEIIRSQHLRFFLGFAEQAQSEMQGPAAAVVYARLEPEHDNMRAALDWAFAGMAVETGMRLTKALAGFWLQSSLYAEAIQYLTRAVERIPSLPDTPVRIQQELDLQMALGPALMAGKGYGAPEAEKAYARAKVLAQRVGDTDQLWPVLWGLWIFHEVRGEWNTALDLAQQMLSLAHSTQDRDLTVEAHRCMGDTLHWLGEFSAAWEHCEQAFKLYQPERHHVHIALVGEDVGVCALIFSAYAAWHLGLLAQSLQRSDEALALARKLAHAFTYVQALTFASAINVLRREWEIAQELANEAITVARQQGYVEYVPLASISLGTAVAEEGQPGRGIALIEEGLQGIREREDGEEALVPNALSLLALALARNGQASDGLHVLDEAFLIANKNNERWSEAEMYRRKGELLLQLDVPDDVGAEDSFRKALEVARRQSARSLELRAALSLSRLLRKRGDFAQARQLLGDCCAWFGAGVDSMDLQEARLLLQTLV